MGHSAKRLISLPLLLVLLTFTEHIQAEETERIKRIKGTEVRIQFKFNQKINDSTTVKFTNLYMNGSKIDVANSNGTDRRRNFSMTAYMPVLKITNLSETDVGVYHASLFLSDRAMSVIESKKVLLIIQWGDNITESPPTYNHTRTVTSETPPPGTPLYVHIISVLVVTIVVLSTVLLWWLYLTNNKSPDCQLPQGPCTKCQVTGEPPSSLPVSTIEYGVLDFHSRPGEREADRRSASEEPPPRDSVEYSTITFFPGVQGSGVTAGVGTRH
ncbi:hypothetical protein MATL_G00241090 [Megalops atlanticus]|uniref:Uncharacterized protein n=1 Tax=Megalops atlanticus TaxID=7932 RepID=A0A9D3SXF9_MEGAT|nr:hypothetical protein MATL_G00241090 [Megalops atlanticus]